MGRFRHLEVLDQGHVGIPAGRIVEHVASRVAEGQASRCGEGHRIPQRRAETPGIVGAEGRVAVNVPHDVRKRGNRRNPARDAGIVGHGNSERAVTSVDHGKGSPTLKGGDARHFPSSENAGRHAVKKSRGTGCLIRPILFLRPGADAAGIKLEVRKRPDVADVDQMPLVEIRAGLVRRNHQRVHDGRVIAIR